MHCFNCNEAVQGLQIRYASFSNILTNMKNYLCIMNQGLQIRYALLQVQLLLQYNTDSKINKLAKHLKNSFLTEIALPWPQRP